MLNECSENMLEVFSIFLNPHFIPLDRASRST